MVLGAEHGSSCRALTLLGSDSVVPNRVCSRLVDPQGPILAKKAGFEALFAMAKPCPNCPFLKVGAIELNSGRLEGIIASLLENDWTTFSCHKTVHSKNGGTWSDDGDYTPSGKEAHCMGAMAYLKKIGMPNVPMRIGFATGMLKIDEVQACEALVIDEMKVLR